MKNKMNSYLFKEKYIHGDLFKDIRTSGLRKNKNIRNNSTVHILPVPFKHLPETSIILFPFYTGPLFNNDVFLFARKNIFDANS